MTGTSRPTEHDAPGTRAERVAADWLARRDAGAWTPADARALEAWLAERTEHRIAWLRLESAWEETGRLAALGAGLPAGAGPPPRAQASATATEHTSAGADLGALVFAPRKPQRAPRRFALAAVATLAACALAMGWGWHAYNAAETVTHASALGAVQTVALADGSQTTLGSDSRIEARLSRRQRHIDLRQGEAFFDVAKDPDRPFVVEAGPRRAVAVGTRFSVRRDGPDLRVVVTEGLVRLESDPVGGIAQSATLLPAGSVAMVRRDGVLVRNVPLADARQLLDWRSGMLSFRDATLAEAAGEFNRYNARKIVIGDAAVGQLRIGGSFRWSNAEGFVRLLEQGFPVRADYGTDRIVLRSP